MLHRARVSGDAERAGAEAMMSRDIPWNREASKARRALRRYKRSVQCAALVVGALAGGIGFVLGKGSASLLSPTPEGPTKP